jgi:hypothetical protein
MTFPGSDRLLPPRGWLAAAFLIVALGGSTVGATPQTNGFYTVTPCRVADTRNPNGPYGGPALAANSDRTFQFTGQCGIPSTAEAVALNVTVTGATASGDLRIYPAGYSMPSSTAINYRAAITRANNGSYALSSTGGLALHCDQPSGSLHVILDVFGYFETVAAPPPTPTPTPTPGPSGAHVWSEDFGGTGSFDSAVVLGMAVDDLGELATTGTIQNIVNLGTGQMTSAGSTDIFVAKYASNGTPLWSKRFGSTLGDVGKAVAIDGTGSVYITGYFRGSVDFGGGPLSTSSTSAFLAKYSSTGLHLWSKKLSTPTSGMDEGDALAVDGNNNVLVGGIVYQTSDFGGGSLTSAGGADIFLAEYSSTGAHTWSKRMGGTGEDWVNKVAVDGSGGPVVTGYFNASVDFGGGMLTSAGGKDIFVARYSSNGSHVWSKRMGGSLDDIAKSVAVDGGGNVVVTGNFASTSVDFGGGAFPNSGGANIFLVKYSSTGTHVWSKQFGGTLSMAENACDVATDGAGNVLLTGSIVSAIDFGGGSLPSDGWYDIFLAKFSATGAHLWSKRTGAGAGNAIASDSGNNVLAAGTFTGDTPVNFGGSNLSSPGGTDTFLVKLQP